MMLKVKVSGIYTSKHSNGVDEIEFEFIKKIPKVPDTWINSMVQKRFLPLWFQEKNKKAKEAKPYSGLSFCLVSEWEEIDEPDNLSGMDILKMSEFDIQNLACKGLLTEVPLPFKVPIHSLRETAVLEYLKHIKKVKMDKAEDKERLNFFVRSPDGGWNLNLINQKCIIEDFAVNPEKVSVNEGVKKLSINEITNQLPSQNELENV